MKGKMQGNWKERMATDEWCGDEGNADVRGLSAVKEMAKQQTCHSGCVVVEVYDGQKEEVGCCVV